jgi:hypothetical protein
MISAVKDNCKRILERLEEMEKTGPPLGSFIKAHHKLDRLFLFRMTTGAPSPFHYAEVGQPRHACHVIL